MSLTLDVAGFVAAQQDLRQQGGNDIIFSVPVTPTWPAGTKINPDTGEPYDAMVVRSNAEFTTVTVRCLVLLKEGSPLRPQADTHFAEPGLMTGMDIILDIDAALRAGQSQTDYTTVSDATEFQYASKNYAVDEWKPFELGGTLYRYLCYGQER